MARTSFNLEGIFAFYKRLGTQISILERPGYWAWDARHAAQLCDSIYRGLPIAPFILWRTKPDALPCVDLNNKPVEAPETTYQYLIDGRKRINALRASVVAPDLEHCEVFCSIEGEPMFFSRDERPPAPYDLPMYLLDQWTHNTGLPDWTRALPYREMQNRARHVSSRFYEYQLQIVELLNSSITEVNIFNLRTRMQEL